MRAHLEQRADEEGHPGDEARPEGTPGPISTSPDLTRDANDLPKHYIQP